LGAELDVIHIHLAVDQCLAAFEMVYHDKAGALEVADFYGRDETLAHLSFTCASLTLLLPQTSGRKPKQKICVICGFFFRKNATGAA
jgi:hypothetical protein